MKKNNKIVPFANNYNPYIFEDVTFRLDQMSNDYKAISESRITAVQKAIKKVFQSLSVIPEFTQVNFSINYNEITRFVHESTEAELFAEELTNSYEVVSGINEAGISYSFLLTGVNEGMKIYVTKDDGRCWVLGKQHNWVLSDPWMTKHIADILKEPGSQCSLLEKLLLSLDGESINLVTDELVDNTFFKYKNLLNLLDSSQGLLKPEIWENDVIAIPYDIYNRGVAFMQNQNHPEHFDIYLHVTADNVLKLYDEYNKNDIFCNLVGDDEEYYDRTVHVKSFNDLSKEDVLQFIKKYIDKSTIDGSLFTFPISSEIILQSKKDLSDIKIWNNLFQDIPASETRRQLENLFFIKKC